MQYLMYVAYTVYVIAAVLMIGAILLQEGKGGGLSALGGTQAESAFGASNPIRRMTVILSILFFLLDFTENFFEQIVQRNYPRHTAKFIDHNGDMRMSDAKFLQQFIEVFLRRNQ